MLWVLDIADDAVPGIGPEMAVPCGDTEFHGFREASEPYGYEVESRVECVGGAIDI